MSTTTTPNLNLVKPTLGTSEPADVSIINSNMDTIDAAVKQLQDAIANANALLGTLGLDANDNPLISKASAVSTLLSGQAITPASVTATGAIQGSSISDGTGTLAQLRESVYSEVQSIATRGSDLAYFSPKAGYIAIYAEETTWNNNMVISISNAASALFFKNSVAADTKQFRIVFVRV